MRTAERAEVNPSFLERLPLAAAALDFAIERHGGQVRDGDKAPFVLHPLEVGCLLTLAGYPEDVVAAGILHDVLEDTDTHEYDLGSRFGPSISRLVDAVSDDASIENEEHRKAALREQVARGPLEGAAVFAADKVSKARELRLRLSCGMAEGEVVDRKLEHYGASLSMLELALGGRHTIVEQLRFELEMLAMLPPP